MDDEIASVRSTADKSEKVSSKKISSRTKVKLPDGADMKLSLPIPSECEASSSKLNMSSGTSEPKMVLPSPQADPAVNSSKLNSSRTHRSMVKPSDSKCSPESSSKNLSSAELSISAESSSLLIKTDSAGLASSKQSSSRTNRSMIKASDSKRSAESSSKNLSSAELSISSASSSLPITIDSAGLASSKQSSSCSKVKASESSSESSAANLNVVFQSYTKSSGRMDQQSFVSVCTQSNLFNESFTVADAQEVFKTVAGDGEGHLSIMQFEKSLDIIEQETTKKKKTVGFTAHVSVHDYVVQTWRSVRAEPDVIRAEVALAGSSEVPKSSGPKLAPHGALARSALVPRKEDAEALPLPIGDPAVSHVFQRHAGADGKLDEKSFLTACQDPDLASYKISDADASRMYKESAKDDGKVAVSDFEKTMLGWKNKIKAALGMFAQKMQDMMNPVSKPIETATAKRVSDKGEPSKKHMWPAKNK